MAEIRKLGKINLFGHKTREMQRRLSYEAFGLSMRVVHFYRYLGSRANDIPDINDIQNKVFFEVPDRAYDADFIPLPVGFQPQSEEKTDFTRFGLISPMQNETAFRMHRDDATALGRYPVVGDVFEIPMYSNEAGRSFWEVQDVDTDVEYEHFIIVMYATPLSKSRATREIPIDRSNDDLMEQLMDDMDDSSQISIPEDDVSFDPSEIIPDDDFDLRRKTQSSFLDDPDIEF